MILSEEICERFRRKYKMQVNSYETNPIGNPTQATSAKLHFFSTCPVYNIFSSVAEPSNTVLYGAEVRLIQI